MTKEEIFAEIPKSPGEKLRQDNLEKAIGLLEPPWAFGDARFYLENAGISDVSIFTSLLQLNIDVTLKEIEADPSGISHFVPHFAKFYEKIRSIVPTEEDTLHEIGGIFYEMYKEYKMGKDVENREEVLRRKAVELTVRYFDYKMTSQDSEKMRLELIERIKSYI